MKKMLAFVAALPLLIGAFAACGTEDDGAQYAGVCVDPNTNVRVDDSQCSGGGHSGGGGIGTGEFLMMYMLLNSNHSYPAYGAPINRTYFIDRLPAGQSYVQGLPRSGGSSLKSYAKSKYGSSYRAPASKSYVAPGKKVQKSTSGWGGSSTKKSGGSSTKKSGGGFFGGSSKSRSGGGFSSGRRR